MATTTTLWVEKFMATVVTLYKIRTQVLIWQRQWHCKNNTQVEIWQNTMNFNELFLILYSGSKMATALGYVRRGT